MPCQRWGRLTLVSVIDFGNSHELKKCVVGQKTSLVTESLEVCLWGGANHSLEKVRFEGFIFTVEPLKAWRTVRTHGPTLPT